MLPAGVGALPYSIGATLIQHDCCPQHFHLKYSMIDGTWHTSVGASAVDVTVPEPDSLVASDHAVLRMLPPLFKRSPLLN